MASSSSSSLGLTLRLAPNGVSTNACRQKLESLSSNSSSCGPDCESTTNCTNEREEIAKSPHHENDNIKNDDNLPQHNKEKKNCSVISIDLERLVGYQPTSFDTIQSIQSELLAAMWTRYRQQEYYHIEEEEEDHQQPYHQNVPPPDFDDQIKELLETQIARFGLVVPPPTTNKTSSANATTKSSTTNHDGVPSGPPPSPYLVLSYPPKIRNTLEVGLNSGNIWLDTAQAWKEMHRLSEMNLPKKDFDNDKPNKEENSTSFLSRLVKHLMATGRTLQWKHAMSKEIRDLIQRELLYKQHEEWVNTQRQIKLDNLYAVRETLVHQTDVARSDYERLCQIRDDHVSRDIFHVHRKYQQEQQEQQQPVSNRSSNSSNGNDERFLDGFGASDLHFPEEFKLLGLMPANNDYDDYGQEDDWGEFNESDNSDDGSSSSSAGSEDYENSIDVNYDGDSDNDEHQQISSNGKDNKSNPRNRSIPDGENNLQLVGDSVEGPPEQSLDVGSSGHNQIITPFQRRKERMQRAKEQKRKERREARQQAMLDKLKAAEEELRSKYTTTELVLAQTMLQALEKKVENVEELLENIQDEVWAAEEEEENQSTLDESKHELNNDDSTNFSLLDQVLAMILSALPTEPGHLPEEHYQYIKNEHTYIVDQWKNYFGRLPPAASPESGSNSKDDQNTNEQQDESLNKVLTPQDHRKELGIEDNDDEWDAE